MLQDAERGFRDGTAFVSSTAATVLLPAVKKRVPAARREPIALSPSQRQRFVHTNISHALAGVLEDRLAQRAKLGHTEPTLLQMAQARALSALEYLLCALRFCLDVRSSCLSAHYELNLCFNRQPKW